jgi:Rod binding domain-containing protein
MDEIKPEFHPLSAPQAKALKAKAAAMPNPKAEEAADKFETMLAQQLVHSMQSSLNGGSMFGEGVAGDVYNGLAEWELARVLSHNAHFGIKEQLLKQMPKAEVPSHEVSQK